jgi:hypothetical protein
VRGDNGGGKSDRALLVAVTKFEHSSIAAAKLIRRLGAQACTRHAPRATLTSMEASSRQAKGYALSALICF